MAKAFSYVISENRQNQKSLRGNVISQKRRHNFQDFNSVPNIPQRADNGEHNICVNMTVIKHNCNTDTYCVSVTEI